MKTTRKDLPLAAYLRVSTAAQAASGIGLDAQRKTIEDAAQAQGFTVGAWFEDAGRSGARADNRPGLQAALSEITADRLGGIVTAKIDRLGRSSADVMGLVERAQRQGWRLIALDVGLDSTTAAGELVAAALAMAARFEWRRISERQVEKHDDLRRKGRARGRPAVPTKLADMMISMRREGASLQAIADRLNTEGVATVRGGTAWRPSSVRSAILTRERELTAVQRVGSR
jgi:DNA invertase Pin-like site-specific DNA recombinase